MHFKRNVKHLGDGDFDRSGRLLQRGLCAVMIQGEYCGHCKVMKPQFQQAVDNSPRGITWATVELDGKRPDQKKLAARLAGILKNHRVDFRGVPMVVVFLNGQVKSVYEGDRSARSILDHVTRR